MIINFLLFFSPNIAWLANAFLAFVPGNCRKTADTAETFC